MSYLIKDTTEEERRKIVEESLGNLSGARNPSATSAAHVTAVLREWPICMTRISAAKWN